MNGNVDAWRALHRNGYFRKHPFYQGGNRVAGKDVEMISAFHPLLKTDAVMIIGCGYGRETALIAPKVRIVYAIDVPEAINQADDFLISRGITNVEFIVYEREGWITKIPESVDFVYSVNVFQHLARTVARDYLSRAFFRMRGNGLIQFCKCLDGGEPDVEDHRIYEPQVNWTIPEIATMFKEFGYTIDKIETIPMNQNKHRYEWYWVYFRHERE